MAEDYDFPWLDEHDRFTFPAVETASPEGIVGVGGNLSPGMVLSGYRQGIFPWYAPGEPILWWSPDPRAVILPDTLHVPKSMRRILRRREFTLTIDRAFERVIVECATAERDHDGTWITDEMNDAYVRLHRLGYAHSVEVWHGSELAGGLYGIGLGAAFFGESMFSRVSNASKAAFIPFARAMFRAGVRFIDSQVYTDHMARLGAVEIPRSRFVALLHEALSVPDPKGAWTARESLLEEAAKP